MGIIKTKYGYCYSANTRFYDYEDCEDCEFKVEESKRLKNLYMHLISTENLIKSQYSAQKGKKQTNELKKFNENIIENMQKLYNSLEDESYQPGGYRIKMITEPKEREIMIAPFYPDRIVHHCIINVMEKTWTKVFINTTYACIKGRGIHKCVDDVNKALRNDFRGTKYCLKMDVKKFYDNIDHACLKRIIRYRIADEQFLRLLDKIIDSNGLEKGLPIGNYTSQYLANLYLAYFDHWVKEELGVRYYFRYMDDMVILHHDKDQLHYYLDKIGLYLGAELKLTIKKDWQIFDVDERSIDFVGFKMNHYNILLRKSILKRFYKKYVRVKKENNIRDLDTFKVHFPSEYGWIIKCSEPHKNYILKNCINNEKRKQLIIRATLRETS